VLFLAWPSTESQTHVMRWHKPNNESLKTTYISFIYIRRAIVASTATDMRDGGGIVQYITD